ncbi:YjbH domain-containing protein [uncultured Parabacteroides sp.]|uniref:YjbH domain-containing protein n=1 Tax=uncultured Parabacteroides sp. TaxID=512312 RepID=UPI00259AEEDA|nr:YjbH domain-containing protein [uncultured Parabacteroides sp.]
MKIKTNVKFFILVLFVCLWIPVRGQSYMGVSGLLTVPSADMQADGTFMIGGNYLPSVMLPDGFDQNTGNYFLNLTFLPFMEVAYRCTLSKPDGKDANWQQDRAVSLRLRALKEKKYIPSVVLGSNDAFTTNALNLFDKKKANRLFGSVYGILTKNIPMGNHVLGVTAGYYFPVYDDSPNKGFFGGIRYIPGFFPLLNVIADYDGYRVSAGASLLLFRHIRIHAIAYHLQEVSAGIRYEFILIRKKDRK